MIKENTVTSKKVLFHVSLFCFFLSFFLSFFANEKTKDYTCVYISQKFFRAWDMASMREGGRCERHMTSSVANNKNLTVGGHSITHITEFFLLHNSVRSYTKVKKKKTDRPTCLPALQIHGLSWFLCWREPQSYRLDSNLD